MEHMTAAQYQAYLARKGTKQPKHRNKMIYVYEDGFAAEHKIDGHGAVAERFDSEKEHARWKQLQILERKQFISRLERQVVMEIAPAFTGCDGKKHRAITYKADFTYCEGGVEIVEDVKGFDEKRHIYLTTEAFDLKWKLLQAKYPDKLFRLF